MKSKIAALLMAQYDKPGVVPKGGSPVATLACPVGPRKRAFYGLLVPATAPRR